MLNVIIRDFISFIFYNFVSVRMTLRMTEWPICVLCFINYLDLESSNWTSPCSVENLHFSEVERNIQYFHNLVVSMFVNVCNAAEALCQILTLTVTIYSGLTQSEHIIDTLPCGERIKN